MYKQKKIQMRDELKLHVHIWDQVASPKGVIQIVHGMAEHGARYQTFAEVLNKAGYVALADDHRGFGLTARNEEELGHLEPEVGFEDLVEDQHELWDYIETEYPNIPHFIYAHSMGSFVMRYYMTKYPLDGIILAGSGLQPPFLLAVGQSLSGRGIRKNPYRRNAQLNKLAFWRFNHSFTDRHRFSWLSRDPEIYQGYEKDPFCGPIIGTTGFFDNLFEAISLAQNKKEMKKIPADLPILLLTGSDDPVGHFGKDVPKLAVKLAESGVEDVTYKIYEGGRHELINETCKQEVFQDIISWIDDKLTK
ncbi:alpha/beta fold hydrolase [Listeria ilorinensis]|uniref:alpha/beta fold hydrolase n=1 Tax=Listeria ilorinensis TaxID=2867439 RepID=UPI001EF5F257|nr:alpha/beta hydrolase [Listeria ilorinensis]